MCHENPIGLDAFLSVSTTADIVRDVDDELGMTPFFEHFNNSCAIFQTLPIPKRTIGFVFQSFSPRYLLVNFGADILQNTLRLALRSSEILG